jgi:hypothetical protein
MTKWCLLMMASKDPDRSIDIDEALRGTVRKKLTELGATDEESKSIDVFAPIDESLSRQALGENLPIGLVLTSEA